jgi:hypothetical protein
VLRDPEETAECSEVDINNVWGSKHYNMKIKTEGSSGYIKNFAEYTAVS